MPFRQRRCLLEMHGVHGKIIADRFVCIWTFRAFVTSKRLLFAGDARSTSIALKKIVDGHVYLDSVKIDKSSGKPDSFSMNAAQARFILSLVDVLKET
jgi:hypothetical protein